MAKRYFYTPLFHCSVKMYIHSMVALLVEDQFNGFKDHIKSSLSGENCQLLFIDLWNICVCTVWGRVWGTSVDTTDQVNLPIWPNTKTLSQAVWVARASY